MKCPKCDHQLERDYYYRENPKTKQINLIPGDVYLCPSCGNMLCEDEKPEEIIKHAKRA